MKRKQRGNCVHLAMQLSAGSQVLISRDYMTARLESKQAENIYCTAQQDMQKLPYRASNRALAVSQFKVL